MDNEAKPRIPTPEQQASLTSEQLSEIYTAHYPALLQKLVEELRRGRMRPIYPTHSLSAQEENVRDIKEYFRRIKRLVSSSKYQQLVDRFEQVNRECLTLPASQRGTFPKYPPLDSADALSPNSIKDMPILSDILRGTGGPNASPSIQERNELIATLKGHRASHRRIYQTLDRHGYLPPRQWGVKTWREAYQDAYLRSLMHKLFSSLKPIKDSIPFQR